MRRSLPLKEDMSPAMPIVFPMDTLNEDISHLSKIKENLENSIDEKKLILPPLEISERKLRDNIKILEQVESDLDKSIFAKVNVKKNIERDIQSLHDEGIYLRQKIKENLESFELAKTIAKEKVIEAEQIGIGELAKKKATIISEIGGREGYILSLYKKIADGETRNKEIIFSIEENLKTLDSLKQEIADARKEKELISPIFTQIEAVKIEIANLLDEKKLKEKELIAMNLSVVEQTKDVKTRQDKIQEMNDSIAEKERTLIIMGDILEFRKRKKEIEEVKKQLE